MSLIVDKIGGQFTLDGYDNSPDYGKFQMVPVDGTRTLLLKTDQRPVKVEVADRNRQAILLGKFRKKDGSPISGIEPGRMELFTKPFTVPAATEAQFDVQGRQFSNTVITVSEIGDDITFSDSIIIGVKPKITKKVAFVFFSDLQGDVKPLFTEKGIRPREIMERANKSFLSQLNVELQEAEAGKPIGEVTSSRNFGNPIQVDAPMDPEKIKASFLIAKEVSEKFPSLFPSTHFVFLLTRPVNSKAQSNMIDVNIKFSTSTNVIFFTPATSNVDDTMKAFMHEVGHACGAQHISSRPSIMFPNLGASLTMRFLGEHIEAIHGEGPVFPKE